MKSGLIIVSYRTTIVSYYHRILSYHIGRLVAIMREEGVQGLYAGFTAKALRMGLGGAVGITVFELARKLLSSSS